MEPPSFGIRLKRSFDPSKRLSMTLEFTEDGRPCWIELRDDTAYTIRRVRCRRWGRAEGPINHARDCPPVPHDVRRLQSLQLETLQQYVRGLAGWDIEEVVPQSIQREYHAFMRHLPNVSRLSLRAWLDGKEGHLLHGYFRLRAEESGSDRDDSSPDGSESGYSEDATESEHSHATDRNAAVLGSPRPPEQDPDLDAAGWLVRLGWLG